MTNIKNHHDKQVLNKLMGCLNENNIPLTTQSLIGPVQQDQTTFNTYNIALLYLNCCTCRRVLLIMSHSYIYNNYKVLVELF